MLVVLNAAPRPACGREVATFRASGPPALTVHPFSQPWDALWEEGLSPRG